MRWFPPGFGGGRREADELKRDGWHAMGVLVVASNDQRLTWPERELVRQLGKRLYGKRKETARG